MPRGRVVSAPGAPGGADLTDCDREPIHIPGAIQPHGVLLALEEPELRITQVSANVADHLGRPIDAVLGCPLRAVLDPAAAESVRRALPHPRLSGLNPLPISAAGRSFDAIVHRHEGVAMVELEPVPAGDAGMHQPLRLALMGVQSAASLPQLCEVVVREVRELTGFDRVMLYRFDEDGHGSVEAEAREPALEPYLGLHYPASDIPQQARLLYLRNWVRNIPDARYAPVPLVPALRPSTGRPLDLSFSVLRSVSPVHLEYLANMGVRASMSISLVVRDRLWGLISCIPHRGTRFVRYEHRAACEVLGRLTSLQIAALQERDRAALRSARAGQQRALVEVMRHGEGVLEALVARPAELLSLVGAAGAAVVGGTGCFTCGSTPDEALIAQLCDHAEQHAGSEPWSTSCASDWFPAAEPAKDTASGVLTFALPGAVRRRLLWFRPERVRTVSWGGDPRKPVADDGTRLHPRRSFALWQEEVRRTSLPWTEGDLEAAIELRRSAIELDLERQVLSEQRAVRARDDLVAVVSHDLKNPLHVIQMQTALLPQLASPADDESSRRLHASSERIRRAVDHMNTLIHDLLDLAKIEAGRFSVQCRTEDIADMMREALIILRPLAEPKRLVIEQELSAETQVLADRERFFQVLSNLIGNAIKFTPPGGRIRVYTEPDGAELRVGVVDSGPGIPDDQLAHVFNRYWQAQRQKREGSGLGLYIAKGIVEAHGGRLWVEATAGSGAHFVFTLRLADQSGPAGQ
jgi:light-regulated signal transduction histidine kinase (bacteriophytochrome)